MSQEETMGFGTMCKNSSRMVTVGELAEIIRAYSEGEGLLGKEIDEFDVTKFQDYCKDKLSLKADLHDVLRVLESLVKVKMVEISFKVGSVPGETDHESAFIRFKFCGAVS